MTKNDLFAVPITPEKLHVLYNIIRRLVKEIQVNDKELFKWFLKFDKTTFHVQNHIEIVNMFMLLMKIYGNKKEEYNNLVIEDIKMMRDLEGLTDEECKAYCEVLKTFEFLNDLVNDENSEYQIYGVHHDLKKEQIVNLLVGERDCSY